MRCNPWRWLWGLIPILMLSFVAFKLQAPVIESDLLQRSKVTLEAAGYDWADLAFSGRDAFLSGRAADDGAPRKALEAVKSVWGVRVVKARTDLIKTVEDYSWTGTLRDRRLVLSGYVPNNETKRLVLRQAKTAFPDIAIIDEMGLARGSVEPASWLERIKFALAQMRFVTRGRVDLTEETMRIAGEARDFTGYKTLSSQLAATLPAGLRNAENAVTPPVVDVFRWVVELKKNQLTLSGHVPREDIREQLFSDAKSRFPKHAIVDRMETARGAPRNWLQVARLVMREMSELRLGRSELLGRDLTIEGEAKDESTASSIRASLRRDLPETYKLVENITFPKPVHPVASPYVTTIAWVDGELHLTGSAPSEEARRAIATAVKNRFPQLTVVNKLSLATGQPEGWNACIVAGLAGILKFDQGQVQLVDRRLLLSAATRDEKLYANALPQLKSETNRACDADARIELLLADEPKLTWRAVHSEESEIILEGEVPSAEARARLVDTAGRLYPNFRLIDRMEIVSSPYQNWVSVAELGLRMLVRLRSGEAVLHHNDLLVRGESRDTATATSVKTALAREVPKGFVGRERLRVRSDAMVWAEEEAMRKRLEEAESARRQAEAEAARQRQAAEEAERERRQAAERRRQQEAERIRTVEREVEAQQCERSLVEAASRGRILFDVARATLRSESRPTLNELARLAKACPTGIIQIAGHTDSDGTEKFNLELSEQRARSIVNYLAGAGVSRSRLRAVGYGENRPLVPNTTEENKAKNRRIEFDVLLN